MYKEYKEGDDVVIKKFTDEGVITKINKDDTAWVQIYKKAKKRRHRKIYHVPTNEHVCIPTRWIRGLVK